MVLLLFLSEFGNLPSGSSKTAVLNFQNQAYGKKLPLQRRCNEMRMNKLKNLLVLTVFVTGLMGWTLVGFSDELDPCKSQYGPFRGGARLGEHGPFKDAGSVLNRISDPTSRALLQLTRYTDMDRLYGSYVEYLCAARFVESVDPVLLESEYKGWESNKNLELFHKLILCARERVQAKASLTSSRLVGFVNLLGKIRDSCKKLQAESNDIMLLRAVYWKLRFIEPVPGVKEMLASVNDKIEVVSVKNALKQNIAEGKTDIELEQRITKLPEDARKDIEDLRKKLLEEKGRQLAIAKQEEARREKALRKQQKIDQAIKLHKEEIDSSKTNPVLQQQLNADPELKSAVDLWETQYRKELADKKAWEAKRELKKIESAQAEERRRKEAEIAERRRIDEENRIKTKLVRYNVKAEVSGFDLHSNPFKYEGQSIVIRLSFDRMMERTLGVFTSGGHEILVSNLPTDLFTSAGQSGDLIVKVRGTAEVTNLLGAHFKVPHVEYIDILK